MIPLHMIRDALRAEDVIRYHMVRTKRTQNLAEHSFNVAVIAAAIAEELRLTREEINQITYIALTHDLDEVFTGDVPSHTKAALRERGTDWSVLEGNFPVDHTKNSHWIVKIADVVESIRFLRWNGEGPHAMEVLQQQLELLDNLILRRDKETSAVLMKVYDAVTGQSVMIGSAKWRTT